MLTASGDCPLHSHPILLVCLEKGCTSQRLSCIECVQTKHRKHLIQSVGRVRYETENSVNANANNPEKTELLQFLQEFQANCLNKLNELQKFFSMMLNQAQDQIQASFKNLYKSFIGFEQSEINAAFQKQEALQIILKRQTEMERHKCGSLAELTSLLKVQEEMFDLQLNELQVTISQMWTPFRQYLERIDVIDRPKEFKYEFWREQSANMLEFSDDAGTVKNTQNSSTDIVSLAKSPLNIVCRDIGFEIKGEGFVSSEIFLGVCIGSVLVEKQFRRCKDTGNGIYAISQQGMAYNHHDENYSQRKISNQLKLFGKGEKVFVRVDFSRKILFFKVGEFTTNMPILTEQKLYPFVGMQHSGEEVSIIGAEDEDFSNIEVESSQNSDE